MRIRGLRPLAAGILFAVLVSACNEERPAVATAGRTAAPEAESQLRSAEPLTPLTQLDSTTTPAPTSAPPTTTTTTAAPTSAAAVGSPYGQVPGITMFRGNPTRSYHGSGPLPDRLAVAWRFPETPMCGVSPVGGEPVTWCGTGWTGQPIVWERQDGITEVVFGAYDKKIHFLDASTGQRTRPDFDMGDIIKGSLTLDPDGFPLLYAGSRDANFRIIALDREQPTELWRLNALDVPGIWNNDWDSNPVVVDDVMYLGGENSWWYAVALNRTTDADGFVTVDPVIVFDMPTFTPELRSRVGNQQSVESSTLIVDGVAYYATSAGRIVGVDISALPGGEASVVFDFWVGDDVDATLTTDIDGAIYVAAEVDHRTAVGAELGQLVKLDPRRPDDPVMWGLPVPDRGGVDGGIWATPAIAGDILYVPTNPGQLLAVDTADGTVVWSDEVGVHAWSSPVVIDDRLLLAVDCETAAALRIYDISDRRNPVTISDSSGVGGCVESTPAVWDGAVFVGSRDGYFYALTGSGN